MMLPTRRIWENGWLRAGASNHLRISPNAGSINSIAGGCKARSTIGAQNYNEKEDVVATSVCIPFVG